MSNFSYNNNNTNLLPLAEEQSQQYVLENIIKPLLKESYFDIKTILFNVEENLLSESTTVKYVLQVLDQAPTSCECQGKGVVDALFTSLVESLKAEHPVLNFVSVADFSVSLRLSNKTNHKSKTDASVETLFVLEYKNKHNKSLLYFRAVSASLIGSAIIVVLDAIKFLINVELTAKLLRELVRDAKQRNRYDLLNEYTHQLSELIMKTISA